MPADRRLAPAGAAAAAARIVEAGGSPAAALATSCVTQISLGVASGPIYFHNKASYLIERATLTQPAGSRAGG